MVQKKILINQPGGPENFTLVESPVPEPAANEVLIRILYTGVSFADVLIREGVYVGMPHFPLTPGYDITGVVEKAGTGVEKVKPGDLAAALTVTGGYARYIVLPETELIPLSPDTDPLKASALTLNYITAYQMLYRHTTVKPGTRVLIHGAAGGVGTALMQLGALLQLEMYGTVSRKKAAIVKKYGGTPIYYQETDVVKRVRELTGDGVDSVFDGIGSTAVNSYRLLRPNGELVMYGISSMLKQGRKNRLEVLKTYAAFGLLLRNLLPFGKKVTLYQITGLKRKKPEWFREDMHVLENLLNTGKIGPLIYDVLPLGQAARAHKLLNTSGITGKIILDCSKD
ncbi:MAG: medium chain dehydrogenase/reductase family protein [Ignavibacteria bacterium]|nr:medium chain dehydrogenase/reductase family protein [Ignavibacteria bacterium]